ncbi:DNA primase [Sediminibacterium sp.]|uniref:DNA primase n=1 Tax=Sediminibacterium sp. TaxID=1917865 RepID=UPI0027332CC3|nr:DNA primase [Sediminibacterium sp.]MDP3393731.1 DNA primase [Sediminibacterium sp.]MDP3566495.1 DNA primase [Sediminibacterium sp.]
MISPNTIQQITSRIDIIDVVGEFVKLKKRGTNYLGLCPFHGEKSPSFTVSPAKEIYKCFGCGKSGNTITFLMEHEKYSYVEALKWLATRYNIEVEETQQSPEQLQQVQMAESLHAINSFAQQFFAEQLFNSEEGNLIALSYLKERGFREEVLRKFQVGYNPEGKDALTKALVANQFNKELLPKTGLVALRNEELVDNYRGRIIFPIHNNTGKIIGFGARVIGKADRAPKYINTPENEVYSKSKILYGSYFARQAIDKADECLLVEGYTDVVSLHQAGIENVVASGGTSLTIDQLRLVKKYTNNLTIIYDGDSAGIKAALRGLDLAIEEGLNVRLVLIPDGEDPDSYVNKVGATAFNDFIAQSKKDFILFQLEVLLKEAGNDVNKKSSIVNQIAETLSKISKAEDFTRQQDYIKQCAQLLRIDEAGFTNLVNKFKRDKISKEEKKLPFDEAQFIQQDSAQTNQDYDEGQLLLQQDDQVEKNVIRVLFEYGLKNYSEEQTIAAYIFEQLENYPLENPDYEKLIELYKDWYNKGLEPTTKSMLYHEDEQVRQLLINISMFPFELSNRWDEILPNMNIVNKDISIADTEMSLNYFKLRKIKKMFEQNQRDMEFAPFEEQMKLIQLHKQLKEFEIAITKQLGTVILR